MVSEFPEACSRVKDRVLERKTLEADAVQDVAMLKAVKDLRGFSEKKIVGVTALFRAAAVGDLEGLHRCIENIDDGVPVNANDVDYGGRTALHVAASKGWVEVIGALIETYSCQVNVRDHTGGTPLSAAVKQRHVDAAGVIRKAGGKLGWDTSTTASELCEAAKNGDQGRLTMLLNCGANCNAKDCARQSHYPSRLPLV